MQQYEQPQVQILYFLPRERVASREVSREAERDESIVIGSVPEFSEGVEDW